MNQISMTDSVILFGSIWTANSGIMKLHDMKLEKDMDPKIQRFLVGFNQKGAVNS